MKEMLTLKCEGGPCSIEPWASRGWTNVVRGTAAERLPHSTGFQSEIWATKHLVRPVWVDSKWTPSARSASVAPLATFPTSVFRSNLPSLRSLLSPPAWFLSATLPFSPYLLFPIPPTSSQAPPSRPPLTLLQSPSPLSGLPHHSSLAVFNFLLFFRSNAFSRFLYFPLLFLSFPPSAWPFLPLFKLFLLSVSVCPPSLVRLKINDWPIHSSI